MQNKNLFFLFIISLLFLSCQSESNSNWSPKNESEITQIWELSDIKFDNKEGSEKMDLFSEAISKSVMQDGLKLSIFPDGHGTEFHGEKYRTFKWQLTDNSDGLVMRFNNETDTLHFIQLEERKEKKYLTLEYSNLGKFEFLAYQAMLKNPINDPFHPANNEWRIKPKKEESELELKQRLENYVKHYTCILKASMERDEDILSFEKSMGIIKIYRSGIGVIKEANVSDTWKACFFNDEQAEQTRTYYREYLTKDKFKGARSGSWVKDDYEILLNLYRKIHEDIK